MKFNHPLMHHNFTKSDMNAAIKLLKSKNIVLPSDHACFKLTEEIKNF